MTKVWNWLVYLIVLAGFPILTWSGFDLCGNAYLLWSQGVEKTATVRQLNGGFSGGRGSPTFDYTIDVDGRSERHEFRRRLVVGSSIQILVLPNEPKHIAIADKKSNLFHIYSDSIGGDILAAMTLAMFAFMIVAGPPTLWMLLKGWRKIAATQT